MVIQPDVRKMFTGSTMPPALAKILVTNADVQFVCSS